MFALSSKNVLIVFLWIDYLWVQYLRARQHKKTKVTTRVPDELALSQQSFDKSRKQTLQRNRLAFVKDLVSIITTTAIIQYKILPTIWEETDPLGELDEITRSCMWYFFYTTFLAFINLPFTIYDSIILETSKSPEFVIWNQLKNFVVGQIFAVMLCSLLITLIRNGDQVFITFWLLFCLVVFVVGISYPQMAPSKYRQLSPLKPGNLRNEITNLALTLSFPLKEIYIEERFSKKSCSNIYFYGPSDQKSIVILNTLILKEHGIGCTNNQILALISFEFSRWHFNETFKYVIVLETNLLLSFAAFLFLFKHPQVYEIFGFEDFHPVLVGVYVVLKYVMVPYASLLSFGFMWVSRGFVMQNDEFVAQLGKGKALIEALVRLEENNVKFPVCDRLYSMWHYDKPCLMERVEAIKKVEEEKFE
ncbi:CAAX prenyl protease 1 homolog [Tribolium castaneum]|uniref:CAAX prenyl protease 1 homolog-like Protein n=1 Tax=Tribolium castaneum TaxID=7070 RepID=D6X3P6_TRICA|nr:PREDICTED: CAAX prenyl protease 1 homolog [Tribolium castaneum]EEZ97450.1 CAAX prenyl protease 1 homolog-like Protein [Tribolium castaneum]|eukprot:XP_967956.1 PREDICTED: CAAX prenyl protease 1 homolog [Tribolium castaneum]